MANTTIFGGISMTAAADLTGLQSHIMKLSSGGVAKATDPAADKIVGILDQEAVSGGVAMVIPITTAGKARVIAGATIAVDSSVTTDANGKLAAATAGDSAIGYLLEAAVSGKYCEVLLQPHVIPAA